MSLAAEHSNHAGGAVPSEDCAAVAELHRDYFVRLVRLCTRQLRDQALAEDVAQETMLRALGAWQSYDASRPSWPWLKVIALRLCVDAHRARHRELCVSELPERVHGADQTDAVLDEISLRRAMAALPDRQRLALHLRYLDDRDRHESAQALGLNPNAFDQLLSRARLKLAFEMNSSRLGAVVGLLFQPFAHLRRRISTRPRGALGSGALGTMTALPLMVAPLAIAIGTAVYAPLGSPPAERAVADTKSYAVAGAPATQRSIAPGVASHRAASDAQAGALVAEAAAGPARAHAAISKTPLAAGRSEDHRVEVVTPFTKVSVGGDTDHSRGGGLACDLALVQCGR